MPETDTNHEERRPGQWTSRSFGSKLQHGIFYAAIRFGGRRLAYLMLRFVVPWYVLVYPSIRKRTRPYLSRRFPDRTSGWQTLLDTYRLCFSYSEALVDRAVVGILGPDAIDITFPDADKLRELLADGTGLVLVKSHVGSWQVAVAALDSIGRPVSMVMYQDPGDVDRTYFEHAGKQEPYHVIDPTSFLGGTLEMMGVLRRNEVLCMMGDRVLGQAANTTTVEFLGDEAGFPVSALRLASSFDVPVGVLLSHKVGPNTYELRMDKVIRLPKELGRKADKYKPWVREYAETLEAYVQEHPWQFYNFFDMWESQ